VRDGARIGERSWIDPRIGGQNRIASRKRFNARCRSIHPAARIVDRDTGADPSGRPELRDDAVHLSGVWLLGDHDRLLVGGCHERRRGQPSAVRGGRKRGIPVVVEPHVRDLPLAHAQCFKRSVFDIG
jgi:hypothetical protein